MRKITIGLIGIMSILALGLCVILAYGLSGHHIFSNTDHDYSEMDLVLEKEISLDGIDSISILYDMNSNDVFLYESENDQVTVKEYSSYALDENKISTVKTNGNSLEIKGKKRNARFFWSLGMNDAAYTEVWIPSSYKGALEITTASGEITAEPDLVLEKEFAASSTSGDIKIPVVSSYRIDLASTSGEIEAEVLSAVHNGKSGDIHIATTSGDIRLKQVTGEVNMASTSGYVNAEAMSGNTQISTTSGDIVVQRIDGNASVSTTSGYVRIEEGNGDRNVSSISGDISLQGVDGSFDAGAISGAILIQAQTGRGHIETTSGDIRIELSELTGDLRINSTSGYVNVGLPESNSFGFEVNTTSGEINTFFDDNLKFSKKGDSATGTWGADTDGKIIDIETTSGDVRITKIE